MVPVTCRTEYLTGRHHRSATAAWVLMVAGMVALVALNIAGVDGLITAAVVGVILNLALWFGWHFVMPGGRLDPWAAALSGMALVLVFGLRWGVVPVLALCAAAGMALRLAGVA